MRPLTYNGEGYDPVEHERQHLIMLRKAVDEASDRITIPEYRENLRRTARKYLLNHENTPHHKELEELRIAYEAI